MTSSILDQHMETKTNNKETTITYEQLQTLAPQTKLIFFPHGIWRNQIPPKLSLSVIFSTKCKPGNFSHSLNPNKRTQNITRKFNDASTGCTLTFLVGCCGMQLDRLGNMKIERREGKPGTLQMLLDSHQSQWSWPMAKDDRSPATSGGMHLEK